MYNRKLKKLRKKLKPKIVDLPSDWNFGVELVKQLELVKKTKKPIKCKVESDFDREWVELCMPEWQTIWTEKKVRIKWHGRHRAFFLTYIKQDA